MNTQQDFDRKVMAEFNETIDIIVNELLAEKTEHGKTWEQVEDLIWEQSETQWSIYTAQAKNLEWASFWDSSTDADLINEVNEYMDDIGDGRSPEIFAFLLTERMVRDRINAEISKDIPYCFSKAIESIHSLIDARARQVRMSLADAYDIARTRVRIAENQGEF